MLYHITYTDRNGQTQVTRQQAANRPEACREAALRLGLWQSHIKSAVALPKPATTTTCHACKGEVYSDDSGHALGCTNDPRTEAQRERSRQARMQFGVRV